MAQVVTRCQDGEFFISTGTHGLLEGNGTQQLQAGRTLTPDSKGEIQFTISEWINPKQHRLSTSQRHVRPMPMSFPIGRLGIRISGTVYLPPSHQGGQKHPIIYMLNGESAFNAYDTPGGEWGIDEVLDSLNRRRNLSAIVVAINLPVKVSRDFYEAYDENGKENKKLNELTAFIMKDFHNYMIAHYPVRPGRENVFIMAAGNRIDLATRLLQREHRKVGGGILFLPEELKPWTVTEAEKIAKRRIIQRLVFSLPNGAEDENIEAFCRAGQFGENELRITKGSDRCENQSFAEMGEEFGRYILWLLGREHEAPGEYPLAPPTEEKNTAEQ